MTQPAVDFTDKVRAMRKAQKMFFATKSKDWLRESIEWEKEVDKALEAMTLPNPQLTLTGDFKPH